MSGTQEAADPRHPKIPADRPARTALRFTIMTHGPDLVENERTAVLSDSDLRVEDRALRRRLHENRADDHDGRRRGEKQTSQHSVDQGAQKLLAIATKPPTGKLPKEIASHRCCPRNSRRIVPAQYRPSEYAALFTTIPTMRAGSIFRRS